MITVLETVLGKLWDECCASGNQTSSQRCLLPKSYAC